MSQTPTTGDNASRLRGSINRKRDLIEMYLSPAISRRALLLNITLITGALAAALTAAPALGGKSLTDWLTNVLGLSSPAWQVICGGAAICSLAATIATQLLKSHHLDENITQAQAVRTRLEILEVGIESGQISDAEAAAEFMKCIEAAASVEALTGRARRT